jgi:hypothetical protein
VSHDLLAIVRRHLPQNAREGNEDKGGKPPSAADTISPFSSFSSAADPREPPKPTGWGCHREEVNRLLADADEYVERSGVSGREPIVQAAADMVVSAVLTYDIETLRFAVTEFRASVAAVIAARKQKCYPHTHTTSTGG